MHKHFRDNSIVLEGLSVNEIADAMLLFGIIAREQSFNIQSFSALTELHPNNAELVLKIAEELGIVTRQNEADQYRLTSLILELINLRLAGD